MKTLLCSVLALSSLAGCASNAPTDDETEDSADGKADGAEYVPIWGSYKNSAPKKHELMELTLSETEEEEIPAGYDGRYKLTERGLSGPENLSSKGFFKMYKAGGKHWLRFLDEETEGFETAFERYQYRYEGGELVLKGDGADATEQRLSAPTRPFRVECSVTTRFADADSFWQDLGADGVSAVELAVREGEPAYLTIADSSYDDEQQTSFTIRSGRVTVTAHYDDDHLIRFVGPANSVGTGTLDIVAPEGEVTHIAKLECEGWTLD